MDRLEPDDKCIVVGFIETLALMFSDDSEMDIEISVALLLLKDS